MVLILSDNSDPTTSDVIDWLDYLGVKWIRINETDRIRLINIEISNDENSSVEILINNNLKIELSSIKSFWYRRGYFMFQDEWKQTRFINYSENLQSSIYRALQDDEQNAIEFLHHFLQDSKANINSYLSAKNDKLFYLYRAKENGLTVPKTIVCTTKTELLNFYKHCNGNIINKSINEGFFCKDINYQYYSYTNIVQLSDIESSNETFFSSLFQENIEKFVELRIFYFHEKIFCMAIFSQFDENTKVDIRNFHNSLPNREVPYTLPSTIHKKIIKFMNDINLNSGSIDMIITPKSEYIFLEVNPVGQFGYVSSPCNFKIEKQLAEYLKT